MTAIETIVPSMEQQTVSVHLVDEEKHFAKHLEDYVKKCYVGDSDQDNGLNYHIVSVFGSQSTGKSTLLNKLFGTQFDVMDEEKRQQTTKGIWFSHANYIASAESETIDKKKNDKNIFVLDVEGVDGRERADDKDFERKSALFALATSEILIVNIFEHQVGLYQGANMELLKTVMEVNLSLFHKQKQKCLLLFVIRDFTGMTPLSNLGTSLESDMNKIWADLNKPEECTHSKLEDFFDLSFFAITHKYYQADQFELNIKQLGDKFSDESLFANYKYHRQIPIDAWSMYSEKVWDQIEDNKDLDLPTQQILVSKFKCNEILNSIFDNEFLPQFSEIEDPYQDPVQSCEIYRRLRSQCLAGYDSQASRYKSAVYKDIRDDLRDKIDFKLKDFQSKVLASLSQEMLSTLENSFPALKKKSAGKSFEEILSCVIAETIDEFRVQIKESYLLVDESEQNITFDENIKSHLEDLELKLESFSLALKQKEANIINNKLSKKFQGSIKNFIVQELSQPSINSWDEILSKFESLQEKLLKVYKNGSSYDFKLGLTEDENDNLHLKIQRSFWNKFDMVIHDFINDDTVSRILRTVFEDKFKYDGKGLPVIWKDFNQLDSQFNESIEAAVELLPILSSIKLTNGKLVEKPKFAVTDAINGDFDSDDGSSDEEDSDLETDDTGKVNRFATLLTVKQQAKIRQRFKKESDAIYLDGKRSMVANKTSIPAFMYVLLILLGWNEFMAVLRNPFLFILAIITATGLYFAYNAQMLGPMLSVGNAMFSQARVVTKQRLRDLLIDEDENVPMKSPSTSKAESIESYELQDM